MGVFLETLETTVVLTTASAATKTHHFLFMVLQQLLTHSHFDRASLFVNLDQLFGRCSPRHSVAASRTATPFVTASDLL